MDAERVVFEGFSGVRLVADARGDPDGWPVLFLHGGGQTRFSWGSTAEIVAAEGWRSIALDLRGHGDSGWSAEGDYSFRAYAEDCIAVAEQIGRPPVVVGASLGGISAMLAEGSSERSCFSALVLVDITPKMNADGRAKIRAFMESGIHGFGSMEEAAVAIAAYTPRREGLIDASGLMKVLREKDGRWHWHWDPQSMKTPEEVRGLDEPIDAAIKNIRVPTLLVRGLLSEVVDDDSVDDLLARLPGVTVVGVDGAGHMIAGDRNHAFSEAVVSFLRTRIQPQVGH